MVVLQLNSFGCTASTTSFPKSGSLQTLRASVHNLTPGFLNGKGTWQRSGLVVLAAGPGGNVMDKPGSFTLPGLDKGKEVQRRKPPIYRVLLHNDNYNRREYVVRVLLKVVEGFTVDEAVNCMQEAHINGLALVTMCAQEVAERYVEGMRMGGLIATLEPAGPNK